MSIVFSTAMEAREDEAEVAAQAIVRCRLAQFEAAAESVESAHR